MVGFGSPLRAQPLGVRGLTCAPGTGSVRIDLRRVSGSASPGPSSPSTGTASLQNTRIRQKVAFNAEATGRNQRFSTKSKTEKNQNQKSIPKPFLKLFRRKHILSELCCQSTPSVPPRKTCRRRGTNLGVSIVPTGILLFAQAMEIVGCAGDRAHLPGTWPCRRPAG